MKRFLLVVLFIFFMPVFVSAQEDGQTAETVSAEMVSPGTVTFSFKDADIRNVLRLISAKSNVNIVYGPDVTGVVNMELKDVPWEQALGLVLDLNGFAYQRKGNVIKVLKKDAVSKEPLATEVFVLNYAAAGDALKAVEQILSERGSMKTDARSNTLIVSDIPANINKVEAVLKRLDMRTPQVLIETKVIEIKNTKEKDLGIKWTSLKEYSLGFQTPTRTYRSIRRGGSGVWDNATQDVTTDGGVQTTTTTNGSSSSSGTTGTITSNPVTGVITGATQTDTSASSLTSAVSKALTDTLSRTLLKSDIRSAILSAADFSVILSALEEQTDVNLLSNPKILTANNETAEVKVVQEYPIPNYTFDTSTSTFTVDGFDFKDIGVVFDVTPNISSDGYITMKVEPEVSTLLGTIPFTASGSTVNIPLIGRKTASTKMVIKSGDTLAIGGLVDEDKTNVVTKVPLLGDIPVLGRLFRHNSVDNIKRDIIFFITATIIDERTKGLILQIPEGNSAEGQQEAYNKIFREPASAGEKNTNVSSGNKGYIVK